ncbi:nicotinate phosphoribosyltransferase [uncultured Acetobacterium sp.]|uniref:nicotinate phosphoribosyltransferase n=1 Tax=uncultured Acetobacterium sp. TaxID=217139 RepID=UPI002424C870|nr:nicotinate phosphoribosyltransferase [uncultured Acetobacterium sp.]MBU4542125.1 nicotinate phosphoribosyltransferase [Bacillota bacterium]
MQFDRKLQLATDLYQFTMGNVYVQDGKENEEAVFDVFIRNNPFEGGYTVVAGLEQVIEYINGIRFSKEDTALLKKNHPEFSPAFLAYLENFKFEGEIFAIPEGSIIFPMEPIIRVKAPLIQAQIVETTILSIVNHQTLIATKASRIIEEARGDLVMEFGLRRAHGTEAGFYGARAAVIGGCAGTSVVETEAMLDRPAMGTMSHSFILSYDSELEAFEKYVKYNPNNATLLVDTYNTLEKGVPNAITVFKKALAEGSLTGRFGIRIDSGDLAYFSIEARKMLDQAGLEKAGIVASSDLDEHLIKDLKSQGAKINSWGVGTKLITAYDCPALGGVYKLSVISGKAKLKVSNDPEKITNPGYKKVFRIYGKSNGMALADLITLEDEVINEAEPLTIFHPVYTWKKRIITDYYIRELLVPIFVGGKCVYQSPSISDISQHLKDEKESLWPAFKRMVNPHVYHVDLSQKLWNLKQQLLSEAE